MAPDVVLRKLDALRESVQRVEDRAPETLEALLADRDAQDVLVLNLTRAVQTCADIGLHLLATSGEPAPGTMADVFPRLASAGIITDALAERLRPAVGFRNLAVHRYDDIDWSIVHAVRTERLRDFADFARQVRASGATDRAR